MIEKLRTLLLHKIIQDIGLFSIQAKNDTLILYFTDGTNIKIVSDPTMTFEGLSFYIKNVKTVEIEEDIEIT